MFLFWESLRLCLSSRIFLLFQTRAPFTVQFFAVLREFQNQTTSSRFKPSVYIRVCTIKLSSSTMSELEINELPLPDLDYSLNFSTYLARTISILAKVVLELKRLPPSIRKLRKVQIFHGSKDDALEKDFFSIRQTWYSLQVHPECSDSFLSREFDFYY